MKTNKIALLIVLLSVLASACSPDIPTQEMPAVNDENCKPGNIEIINDKGTRQKFASECLRRPSGFKPSEKREW
jgi:entry exclusion lipoprotein TrbK